MTVCIAAIAEANTPYPKIVFVSDRLISTWINYESGVPKIKLLTNYAAIMIASNDTLTSADIVAKVEKSIAELSISGKKITVEEIVGLFSEKCKERLQLEREKQILSKFGLKYETFINKSKDLSKELIDEIVSEFRRFKYDFEADFIVLGIDSKPHIFTITAEGDYKPSDFVGYAIIGSGKVLAFPEITKYAYHPDSSMTEALVRVYNSKKVAERVGDVGRETDLAVLHVVKGGNVGIWVADGKVKDILDKGIESMKKLEIETYTKVMQDLLSIFSGATDKKEDVA
jgi:hypothetical protein